MSVRLHGPRGPRASATLRLAVSAAVALASLTPTPARAAPDVSKEVEDHYGRGVEQRDANNFAAAAQEFTAAYEGMPPELKELRASILFDLVDSHRSAFKAGGRVRGREHPAAHLCAAQKSLDEFIATQDQERRPKAKKSPDTVKAVEIRTAVQAEIDAARTDSPDLDCATAELPRDDAGEASPSDTAPSDGPASPRRKPDMPLVIAGGATAGFGLVMMGLMIGGLVRGNRAEADGEALVDLNPTRPADDPALVDIDHRGKVGNHMAIAGGVLGGLALGAGVALLVIGLRGKPVKSAATRRPFAASPYASPQSAGMTLRWQF